MDTSVSIFNSTFSSNNSTKNGGAVHVEVAKQVEINKCYFYNNTAGQTGGALSIVLVDQVNISNTSWRHNTAQGSGGAIYLLHCFVKNANGVLPGCNIANSFFENNVALKGGAIALFGQTILAVNNSRLQHNRAIEKGGAIHVASTSKTVFFTPGTFLNFNFQSRMEGFGFGIIFSILYNNSAQIGGALNIESEYCATCLFKTIFYKNYASQDGGSIYSYGNNELQVLSSNITDSTAQNSGGCLSATSVIYIEKSNFIRCRALDGNGGAIHIRKIAESETKLVFLTSRVSNSTAGANGGGIYCESRICDVLEVDLQNCTAAVMGGAIYSKLHLGLLNNGIENNNALFGGAIALAVDNIDASNVRYQNNSAKQGAIVFFNTSSIDPTVASVFTSNISNSVIASVPVNFSVTTMPSTILHPMKVVTLNYTLFDIFGSIVQMAYPETQVSIRNLTTDIEWKQLSNNPISFVVTSIAYQTKGQVSFQIIFETKGYIFKETIDFNIVSSCDFDPSNMAIGYIKYENSTSNWTCRLSNCNIGTANSQYELGIGLLVINLLALIAILVTNAFVLYKLLQKRLRGFVALFWNKLGLLLMDCSEIITLAICCGLVFARDDQLLNNTKLMKDSNVSTPEDSITGIISCEVVIILIKQLLYYQTVFQISHSSIFYGKVERIILYIGVAFCFSVIIFCSTIASVLIYQLLLSFNNWNSASYLFIVPLILNTIFVWLLSFLLFLLVHILYTYKLKSVWFVLLSKDTWRERFAFVKKHILFVAYTSFITSLPIGIFVLFYMTLLCRSFVFYLSVGAYTILHIALPIITYKLETLPIKQRAIDDEHLSLNLSLLKNQDIHNFETVFELETILPSNYIIDPSQLKPIKLVGSGAQGTVYLGEYNLSNVAIKTCAKETFGSENNLKDFFTESAALLKYTNHPNIIRFLGLCDDKENKRISIVTEFYEKGSLATILQSHSILLNWNQKLRILYGIASGMAHLHQIPIIHRDLKCENVLLDGALNAKIADFGLAKYLTKQVQQNTMTVGTAPYMAPEVIKSAGYSKEGKKVASYDERCDIYSFAIIMYCLVEETSTPYTNRSDIDIIMNVIQNDLRPSIASIKFVNLIEQDQRWYIDLMQQCWSSAVDIRPSFVEICQILKQKLE